HVVRAFDPRDRGHCATVIEEVRRSTSITTSVLRDQARVPCRFAQSTSTLQTNAPMTPPMSPPKKMICAKSFWYPLQSPPTAGGVRPLTIRPTTAPTTAPVARPHPPPASHRIHPTSGFISYLRSRLTHPVLQPRNP